MILGGLVVRFRGSFTAALWQIHSELCFCFCFVFLQRSNPGLYQARACVFLQSDAHSPKVYIGVFNRKAPQQSPVMLGAQINGL